MLLMALAWTGLWIRSYLVVDSISVPIIYRQNDVLAYNGKIAWAAYNREPPQYLVSGWTCAPLTTQYIDTLDHAFDAFDPKFTADEPRLDFQKCSVSYWSVVFPVTFLSAYLLLWKPRNRE